MTIEKEIKQIPLGTYLFQRLTQVNNLKSIFGVPGDFNLPLLERLYNVKNLKWVGNCNELNAGYAADGYARINGFGALVTTFGVGELSAINAINGSFVENVPVLHIVGTSSTSLKKNNTRILHHLVTRPNTWELTQDHFAYEKIVDSFSICKESLTVDNLDLIQDKIDTVIETIYRKSKPGYLFIPVDIADIPIPVDVNKKLELQQIDSNPKLSSEITLKVIEKLQSKNFAVLVDSLIEYNTNKELNSFLTKNRIHSFGTPIGKGKIDESMNSNLYHGTYFGKLSTIGTVEDIKNFDMVLHLGYNFNESNNYSSEKIQSHVDDVIEIGKDFVSIDGELYSNVNGWVITKKILENIDETKIQSNSESNKYQESIKNSKYSNDSKISQASLLNEIQSTLNPNDIIVIEMCSFVFATADFVLPDNVQVISQMFYGSIGYALPSTLGVSLAVKDSGSNRRVILIEGDGSAQMTIQELTSYVRYNIEPLMILLNNEGYTVERAILGEKRSYNDIAPNWNWTQLFKVFGDVNNKSESVQVSTNGELQKGLIKGDKLKLVEVLLDRMDVPWRFEYICGKKKF